MALPIVAVVGRPNVGKSTFVNRIAQVDDAIVHEMRGVTRDRSYHEADWNGVFFKLIDTGGIEMGNEDAFQGSIRNQAFEATNEADMIVFVVDGKTGINADDEEVARILRRSSKPVLLAVNKMDHPNRLDEMWEFYQLGLGDPWPISAVHGNGTGDLLDELVHTLHELGLDEEEQEEDDSINVAIIGRPNAGKSSLTNQLTNNQRSIVSNVAGTTRDAIDTVVEHDGQKYTIVDTAGLRRKSAIDQDVEYYGFVRAMRAIDRADVALLVVDSTLGLTNEDQRVAGYAAERGCAIAVILNKWDVVGGPEEKARIRQQIEDIYRVHYPKASSAEIRERAMELLKLVNLPPRVYNLYPHEMSGGMLQRVAIAISLLHHPQLLIFDEATTALDVVTQGQILKEIVEMEKTLSTTRIMITHDMSVVATTCNKVAVMYAGELMEYGMVTDVLTHPHHPYTQGLQRSFPSLKGDNRKLESIPGFLPDLSKPCQGCVFAPRCPHATERCFSQKPPMFKTGESGGAACWLCEGEENGK